MGGEDKSVEGVDGASSRIGFEASIIALTPDAATTARRGFRIGQYILETAMYHRRKGSQCIPK